MIAKPPLGQPRDFFQRTGFFEQVRIIPHHADAIPAEAGFILWQR